jgi:hypothetical protein
MDCPECGGETYKGNTYHAFDCPRGDLQATADRRLELLNTCKWFIDETVFKNKESGKYPKWYRELEKELSDAG